MRLQCRITLEERRGEYGEEDLLGISFYREDILSEASRGVNIYLQDDIAPCTRTARGDDVLLGGPVINEWGELLLSVFPQPPAASNPTERDAIHRFYVELRATNILNEAPLP